MVHGAIEITLPAARPAGCAHAGAASDQVGRGPGCSGFSRSVLLRRDAAVDLDVAGAQAHELEPAGVAREDDAATDGRDRDRGVVGVGGVGEHRSRREADLDVQRRANAGCGPGPSGSTAVVLPVIVLPTTATFSTGMAALGVVVLKAGSESSRSPAAGKSSCWTGSAGPLFFTVLPLTSTESMLTTAMPVPETLS